MVLLQVAASQVAWPWWIELPVLLSVAFGVMLGSYRLFVRSSWIGAWLDGRRTSRLAAMPDGNGKCAVANACA